MEHEDYLFEVHCSCGARFNPFMTQEDAPRGVDEPAPQRVESQPENAPSENEKPVSTEPFQESAAAFTEIRQFGESVGIGSNKEKAGAILTAAFEIPGHIISNVIGMVSVVAALSAGDSPLRGAFDNLTKAVRNAGGGALVGLRWQLVPDSKSVVASGTVVNIKER